MARPQFHEDFRSRPQEVVGPSDRAFGITFTAVLVVAAFWPLLAGASVRLWALALAGVFAVLAVVRPGALGPLNRLWLRLGLMLHRVSTPLVLGVVYFGIILPTGIVMRLMGRQSVQLRPDRDAASYWIPRSSGPESATMRNQF